MHDVFYKMERCDKKFLESHGFRLLERMSSEGETVYIYRFPVHKWNDRITIDGRILVIEETGDVRIDVLDRSDGSYYAPWYNPESKCHEKLLDDINMGIKRILKYLKIKEKTNESTT